MKELVSDEELHGKKSVSQLGSVFCNLILVPLLAISLGCSYKSGQKDSRFGQPKSDGSKSEGPPKGDFPGYGDGSKIEPLNAYAYLRKLSLHLRGVAPHAPEYAAIKTVVESNDKSLLEAHLKFKIQEYLDSPLFVDKMEARLEELFSLAPSPTTVNRDLPFEKIAKSADIVSGSRSIYNSMNELFRRVVSQNLPWDSLLTTKDYVAYKVVDGTSNMDDPTFYRFVATVNAGVEQVVHFSAQDKRVAGVLSTSRFFSRYTTTSINKNRRRAAAIFKVFLCDDMTTVTQPTNEDSAAFDLVFAKTQDGPHKDMGSDPHGADPACMKCHSKLDPAGLFFAGSNISLAPKPSFGKLTFKSKSTGQKVDAPGYGLSGLADALISQPDYRECQVNHFWKWFIGTDFSDLAIEERSEAMSQFDQLGRRPKDFVKYLVSTETFKLAYQPKEPSGHLKRVKLMLERCDTCHKSTDAGLPRFAKWPIGGSAETHLKYVSKIAGELGLTGKKASMPPAPPEGDWVLSADELQDFKLWISNGGQDAVHL